LTVESGLAWGAANCPPAGDLRGRPAVLLAATDLVVPTVHRPPVALAGYAGARVGLLASLARPHRVVASLAAVGIAPHAVVRAPDHAPPSRATSAKAARIARDQRLDLWLATEKCRLHWPAAVGGTPVVAIPGSFALPAPLEDRLRQLVGLGARPHPQG
jgi:tetraacyldisaccharide-1-P 4'-kinase